MNELPRSPKKRPTTQAAEGVPRLRWTLAEFERLTELGILTEDDRIELIGGELVPMSPKGNRHEVLRDEIVQWMIRHLPTSARLSVELGWRPDASTYLEPDLLVYPNGRKGVSLPGSEMLLAVEIADSSLRYDTTTKAGVYAGLGVPEYWVIDARSLVTTVYREPSQGAFATIFKVQPSEMLTPALVPELALRLADLSLD